MGAGGKVGLWAHAQGLRPRLRRLNPNFNITFHTSHPALHLIYISSLSRKITPLTSGISPITEPWYAAYAAILCRCVCRGVCSVYAECMQTFRLCKVYAACTMQRICRRHHVAARRGVEREHNPSAAVEVLVAQAVRHHSLSGQVFRQVRPRRLVSSAVGLATTATATATATATVTATATTTASVRKGCLYFFGNILRFFL